MIPDPPATGDAIVINDQLAIPADELRFRFSRSSGPGGQHVQRSDTRAELLFDVAHSPSLTDEQRERISQRLAGAIDGDGVLRVVSSTTRSQLENRADAVARFRLLLAGALRKRKRRIPTRPSAASRESRLAGKRAHADAKRGRRRVPREDYD